jgi:hypothetical protein
MWNIKEVTGVNKTIIWSDLLEENAIFYSSKINYVNNGI